MKGLERTLGLSSVIAISIGAMLGSGVFVLPGLAAAKTGHSVWLAYLVAGLSVLPAALAKAELATAMPTSGGTYVYLDRAFGPWVSTISGLGLWVSLLFKSAFALVGFGAYLITVYDAPRTTVALVTLAVIVLINLAGVGKVGKAMLVVVAVALVGLWTLVMSAFGVAQQVEPSRFFDGGAAGFFGAAAFVVASYSGVTKVAAIAEEVKNPQRNLPVGILLSLGIVLVLYAGVAFALVEFVPTAELVTDLRPIHTLAGIVFGPVGATLFAVIGIVTMASMANAGLLASSRFPFAMARDRLLPPVVAKLHPKRLTPVVSILATAVCMGLAIQFLEVERLAKIASAFVITIFAVENVALIVLRETGRQWYQPTYRVPLYPVTPIAGIFLGFVLLATMGMVALAAVGSLAVIGTLVYLLYGRRRTERQGVVGQLAKRQELMRPAESASVGRSPEGDAAVTVAIFGWERSPEVLVGVGAALADHRHMEVVHLTESAGGVLVEAALEEETEVRSLRRRVEAMAQTESLDLQFDAVVTRDLLGTAHGISSRLHCEWLVIGWRRRENHKRFLFMNPLGWLVNHLHCNLALYRDLGVRYIRKIVAYPSPGPDDALVAITAAHLAEREGARLTFARFVPDDADPSVVAAETAYAEGLGKLCSVPTSILIVRGEHEVKSMVALTASFDLLVTAAAPGTSWWRDLRGSVVDRIKEGASCSVLSLRSPVGRTHDEAFGRGAVASSGASKQEFDLLDHVESGCLVARLDVRRQAALFEILGEAFAAVLPDVAAREITQALRTRERAQSTSVGSGVAMPHTTLPSAVRPLVGIFTLGSPIDYAGAEDAPVDVIVAMVSPPKDRQVHLQILAVVSWLIVRTGLLEGLRAASSSEEMTQALRASLDETDGTRPS